MSPARERQRCLSPPYYFNSFFNHAHLPRALFNRVHLPHTFFNKSRPFLIVALFRGESGRHGDKPFQALTFLSLQDPKRQLGRAGIEITSRHRSGARTGPLQADEGCWTHEAHYSEDDGPSSSSWHCACYVLSSDRRLWNNHEPIDIPSRGRLTSLTVYKVPTGSLEPKAILTTTPWHPLSPRYTLSSYGDEDDYDGLAEMMRNLVILGTLFRKKANGGVSSGGFGGVFVSGSLYGCGLFRNLFRTLFKS